MNIDNLFAATKSPAPSAAAPSTKTASANQSASDLIRDAMNEALAPATKTASEAGASPEATVLKLAQDLAAREKLAEVDHGYRVGRSMSRGFLDGIAEAEKVAAAAEQGAAYEGAKLAAAEQAAHQQGYDEVMNAARADGANHYLAGYSMFEGLL